MAATVHHERIRADLRLLPESWTRWPLALFLVALVAVPLNTSSDFALALGITIGIYTIGAIGLNLLSGYAGQISLGHSFFVGVGAYAAIAAGGKAHLPLPLWLASAVLAGAAAGLLVGPFALRLHGIYQVVLTLGLVYIGQYIFVNWTALTGGNNGTSAEVPMTLGPIDFAQPAIGPMVYTAQQGLFVLVWLLTATCLLVTRNIMRSRAGRALMALRDFELAATVAGVSPARTKVAAFAAAGGLAGLAGALLVAQLRYVAPAQFDLNMSLQFVVIIIVGGVARLWGPVLGAAVVCSIPQLTSAYGDHIPLVRSDLDTAGGFGLKTGQLNLILYGLVLALFVITEPQGLTGILTRLRSTIRAKPPRRP